MSSPNTLPRFSETDGVLRFIRRWNQEVILHLPARILELAGYENGAELMLGRTERSTAELVVGTAKPNAGKSFKLKVLKSGLGKLKVECGYIFVREFFHKPGHVIYTPAFAGVRELPSGNPVIYTEWPDLTHYLQGLEESGPRPFRYLDIPILS